MTRIKFAPLVGVFKRILKPERLLIMLMAALVVTIGLWAALPWLKSKGIVPVSDNERRDALHTSRDQKAYSAVLLKELEAREAAIEQGDSAAKYEFYSKKADELTALERYDEAEKAYATAEKYVGSDPKLAEAHFINFGMMYESKGDKQKANEQYAKAKNAVAGSDIDASLKKIKLEEIETLLKRTR